MFCAHFTQYAVWAEQRAACPFGRSRDSILEKCPLVLRPILRVVPFCPPGSFSCLASPALISGLALCLYRRRHFRGAKRQVRALQEATQERTVRVGCKQAFQRKRPPPPHKVAQTLAFHSTFWSPTCFEMMMVATIGGRKATLASSMNIYSV